MSSEVFELSKVLGQAFGHSMGELLPSLADFGRRTVATQGVLTPNGIFSRLREGFVLSVEISDRISTSGRNGRLDNPDFKLGFMDSFIPSVVSLGVCLVSKQHAGDFANNAVAIREGFLSSIDLAAENAGDLFDDAMRGLSGIVNDLNHTDYSHRKIFENTQVSSSVPGIDLLLDQAFPKINPHKD